VFIYATTHLLRRRMERLRSTLAVRSFEPRPAASKTALAQFERSMGLRLDPSFRALYAAFDGCEIHDPHAWIWLWPWAEILGGQATVTEGIGGSRAVIGDLLINCDVITADLADASAPVRYHYADEELGSSLRDFLDRLAKGTFDFM